MVFGLSRKENKVPDLSRYDYYYQNSQDYNRSAQLSAAAASAASASGRRVNSAQYTPQPQQYHYAQPTYRRAHSLAHSPADHYGGGGSVRRSVSGNVGLRHVSARDSRQQLRSGTASPKGNVSPQLQKQQQQQPRQLKKKRNPQYKTYSLRSQDSDEIQLRTRKPRQPVGTATSSRSNSNGQTTQKQRATSAQAPPAKKKVIAKKPKRTVSTPVTTNDIQPMHEVPKKVRVPKTNKPPVKSKTAKPPVKSQTAKPPVKTKTTTKKKVSASSQGRLDSLTSNASRQLRRVGTNDSRSNSITTRITTVKDAQGRTQSITKKTIKRIDGYDYIETTTTTTTVQPASELESLDSDQRHFDEFNEDFITDNDFAPIQDIDEEPEDEDLMEDAEDNLEDDQSIEEVEVHSQIEDAAEYEEDGEYIQDTEEGIHKTSTIDAIEEEDEEEESPPVQVPDVVRDASQIDNVMLREESESEYPLNNTEVEEEELDDDDTEVSHPSLAPPRTASGSLEFMHDHGGQTEHHAVPDVHVSGPSSDEDDDELIPHHMLATDSAKISSRSEEESIKELQDVPEEDGNEITGKAEEKFPEAISNFPTSIPQVISENQQNDVESQSEDNIDDSNYPDEIDEEEIIDEMAEESQDDTVPEEDEEEQEEEDNQVENDMQEQEQEQEEYVQSEEEEKEQSQEEEIPGAYDYEDDYENPYAESVESTVHNAQPVIMHSSASTSADLMAKPRKVSHPYASAIANSPQSSNSIFTDALDVVPNETAKYHSNSQSKRKVLSNNSIRSSSMDSNTRRLANPQKSNLGNAPKRTGGSMTRTKSIKSVKSQKPPPKKPLTEAEMYQKALEIATKKVYSNNVPTTVKKDTKSMMGQRMTLRQDHGGMQSSMMNNSVQQNSNPPQEKRHKKGLSLFSFEKHQDGTTEHHLKNPLPTIFKSPSPTKEPEVLQPKVSAETKSTMSDADMYAKALEVAKKKYNDSHYIQATGIPVVHSNVSANSGFSGGILSNTSNIITDNSGRVNSNDQFSKRTFESAHHVETSSGDQFLRNEPSANNDSIGMRLSVDSRKKIADGKMSLKQNDDSLTHLNHMISTPQTDNSITGMSAVATPGRITTAPEPNRYIASNIDNHITMVAKNNTNVPSEPTTVIPLQKLPTTESAKKKSKFKNFLGKVVQFSTENSGYQLSKDEQHRLDEDKMAQGEQYAEQHKFFNLPPQHNQITMGHPAAQSHPNVNVAQRVESQPLGKTESVSSFQRRNTHSSVPETNGNTAGTVNTAGSSLFSKNKGRMDISPPQTSANYILNDGTNVGPTIPVATGKIIHPNGQGSYPDQATPQTAEEEEITPVTVVGNNSTSIEKHTVSKPAPMHGPKKKGFFKKLFHRS